jgi:hypothetical protein
MSNNNSFELVYNADSREVRFYSPAETRLLSGDETAEVAASLSTEEIRGLVNTVVAKHGATRADLQRELLSLISDFRRAPS